MSESSDPFATQLRSLEPTVDMEASRRLFDRDRAEQRDHRRWLLPAAVIALLIAGLVGVWALARDGAVVPADPIEELRPVEQTEPSGGEFEVVAVEQTAQGFGWIRAAANDADYRATWGEALPGTAPAEVDLERNIVVAFILPDDACPDIVTRFEVDATGDTAVWEPRLEPPPGGCDEPLVHWVYVIAVERAAVAPRVTFRLRGTPASEFTIDVEPPTVGDTGPDEVADEAEPAAAEVVLRTDLPPAGSAESVMTLLGPIWIVHHDDGSVSALPAVVRVPVDEDIGVTGLGRFVAWDDSTRSFAGRWIHDEYGRAINGPRTDDLVGLEAGVDGEFVEIWRSDRDRVPGAPLDVPLAGDDGLPPLDLGETLDLDVLPTLSFSGPVWRMLDATLVVEQGVGTLCVVDREAPVPDLVSCGGTGVDTAVTSSRPDVTSWFFGPVLAEFDEFGEIITVVTSHGQASRNDGPPADVPLDQIEVVVDDVVSECNPPDPGMVIVTLVPGWDLEVVVDVSVGGDTRGSTTVALRDGVPTEVRVEVTGPLDAAQTVTVRSAVDPTVEYTSLPHVGCA